MEQDTDSLFTEPAKKDSLKRSKQIAWAYNIVGMLLGFSMIFVPVSKLVVIVLLCYPLLGIMIMALSNGLIKFVSESKESVYGFTMLGVFLPSFTLMLKSLIVFNIANYHNLWLPFIAVSAIVFALLYFIGFNDTLRSSTAQVVMMMVVSLLYGLGSARHINCLFDTSAAKVLHTTVYDRWIEHGKGTHYHLKITSWDADPQPKDIEVEKFTYDQNSPGASIDVYLKSGLFRIPWYYINE